MELETWRAPPGDRIPNHPHFPVLVYHGVEAAAAGHRRATERNGFTVVGAYPAGQEDYDLLRGDDPAEVAAARERIAALPAPPHDPVGGEGIPGWRAG
jgi:uncharacterized protein YjlB